MIERGGMNRPRNRTESTTVSQIKRVSLVTDTQRAFFPTHLCSLVEGRGSFHSTIESHGLGDDLWNQLNDVRLRGRRGVCVRVTHCAGGKHDGLEN